jgi:ketosteroid isomerase-like protein
MRRLLAAAFSLCLAFPAFAASHATDDAGIRAVIEDFRTAIIEKDQGRFLGLFLHEGITWQSVMSDARLEKAKQSNPELSKAAYDAKQSPAGFIAMIAKDPKRHEETFADVQIDSDGDAASVAFDFSYVHDGRVANAGREYWLLVRADSGWRIAAVTWSSHPPAKK